MAKAEGKTASKPRAAARTLEQQIADLTAKAEAAKARKAASSDKKVTALTDKITVAESKLAELYLQRDALTGEPTFVTPEHQQS
jgi:phage shock protein A